MTTHPTTPPLGLIDKRKPLVSLVIIAFNEEENLPELFRRVTTTIEALPDYAFECILVDNCSVDRTGELARSFAAQDERWRYLRFSRNFGAEVSLAAGLHYATGDALVFLPSDLQDPPESLPVMIEKWQEGYDVVYGELIERNDESAFKGFGAYAAYKLIYWLSDTHIPPNVSDFRLITRPVIEAVKRFDERNRYLRGIIHWVGFRQTSFPHRRNKRLRGESSAGLIFCIQFALNALFVSSIRPLRWASLFGVSMIFFALFGMVGYTMTFFLSRWNMISLSPPPPGWTTMILALFFFGGMQSFFLGLLGEYLGRIYVETKQRPLWVLQETAGFPPQQDPLSGYKKT